MCVCDMVKYSTRLNQMKVAQRFYTMQKWSLVVILAILSFSTGQQETLNTELVAEQDDPLLLLFTLNGSLVGVSQQSGTIRWQQNDEPAVSAFSSASQMPNGLTKMPVFLPDVDGSIYLSTGDSKPLKKLPFTIPQLVANSPCKSSDGIFYTGKKIDVWFSINPATGEKEQLSFAKVKDTCPLEIQNTIFVGRAEYSISMVDSKHKDRKWNLTFYDYSAAQMAPDVIANYDLLHFTTSATGRVVTLDRRSSKVLWELDLESPVIAMYFATKDELLTIPFKRIADSSLEMSITKPTDVSLLPTLYIGEHQNGPYALPSLVAMRPNNTGHLLLGGPLLTSNNSVPEDYIFSSNIDDANKDVKRTKDGIALGHYKVPVEYKLQTQILQITGLSNAIILDTSNSTGTKLTVAVQTDVSNDTAQSEGNRSWQKIISKTYNESMAWIINQDNKNVKLTIAVSIIIMVSIMYVQKTRHLRYQQQHRHLSLITLKGSRESSRTSNSDKAGYPVVMPEDIGEGLVKVGKIIFDTGQVLGKGCDGTFVYRGEFDGRAVAVKRLLPDCFMFADREVALLRESDAHENVVRYFCTEQDRMFRYIALELAEATLQDYVAGTYDREKISVKNILYQATSGLAHLHILDIVHRDIKPHNVLLSVPGPRGEVRVMISDFGLCKKLQLGRVSFSRRSGVTGTDGWIAPEMLNGERTTCAVDIFSLGCVFYYVLSNGKHPFGDSLRRQANILCGESDLTGLQEIYSSDKELALLVIKAMICNDPAERPPASAICNYPIFWNSAKILSFFQDISDRVEKDQRDSPTLIALEACNERVIQGDWRLHIDAEVAADLRKYRSYRGESVRDLLRALRNKKHHYRELSQEAQKILGEIPDEFADYWLLRFPRLLRHVWCAMQSFRDESNLKHYYHPHYTFASNCEGQQANVRIDEISNTFSTLSTSTIYDVRKEPVENVNFTPNRRRSQQNNKKKHVFNNKKKEERTKQEDLRPLIWSVT